MNPIINYEETVPDEARDALFKEIKKINRNNICIDCEKKNPTWASIHLAVHLCIDCAGKHRQYGVMYSFVKSTNLDKWNRKQLLFMQKGSNQRALEYLTKCGVISDVQKHIDYKSPIVQRYKGIITEEVDIEMFGRPSKSTNNESSAHKSKVQEKSKNQYQINAPQQIGNAQTVQNDQKSKKKSKKKVGKKIDMKDFEDMVFDDGVPQEQKQKIVKAYESHIKTEEKTTGDQTASEVVQQIKVEEDQKPKVEPPKQMSQQQSKKLLDQLKAKQNLKSISSDQFKDTSTMDDNLKQNLSKLQGSQSISSSALFGGEDVSNQEGQLQKIKDIVTDVSGKLYGKLSSYWTKK